MKAEFKANLDTKRTPLADVIPLAHPYTVYIEVTRYCNLKCFYCLLSTQDDEGGAMKQLGLKTEHMDQEGFATLVEQLAQFPKGIKRIVFSGLGEPLMNPHLPEMIRKVADARIADRIDVITNGLLITRKKADELIASGVTNINVSIQGVASEQYEKFCGKSVDFAKLVDNLTYLYENRGDIKIYIKAVDAALSSSEDQQTFMKIFGNICDRIYIEHLIVMQQQMEDLRMVVDPTRTFYGEPLKPRQVCAQSFYFFQIGCNFDTFPCPNPGLPRTLSMGNMREQTLLEIWNGDKRRQHLIKMLRMEKDEIPDCRGCTTFTCVSDPTEDLDRNAAELVARFL